MNRFFFRLAGTSYEVLQHCSADTISKYRNLVLALFLTAGLSFIGGADIAHQFTTNEKAIVGIGSIWAITVFSFDHFLINGGNVHWAFALIRIPVGFSNIFITVVALFVMLNQATIDSTLRLTNASKVTTLDSIYFAEKETRYHAYNEKKAHLDEYHQKNCIPEALNGFPGSMYYRKHTVCMRDSNSLAVERAEIDHAESGYQTAYQNQRQALNAIAFNDFFAKSRLLPQIIASNKFILILAIALFVFLSYVELQCLILKFSIRKDDEYHKELNKYHTGRKGLVEKLVEAQLQREKYKDKIAELRFRRESKQEFFMAGMQEIDQFVMQEYEAKKMQEILEDKGYSESSSKISELIKSVLQQEDADSDTSVLFKITQPMQYVVDNIKASSNNSNLPRKIFDWVVANIKYDNTHSREFYRGAIETYNNKLGVCGELSVLLMAFYKAVNIECHFCEVTVDSNSVSVAHACVAIEKGNRSPTTPLQDKNEMVLIDPAYKIYDTKHIQHRIVSDKELVEKYKIWNHQS